MTRSLRHQLRRRTTAIEVFVAN